MLVRGFNLRSTEGYVTDGSRELFVGAQSYP